MSYWYTEHKKARHPVGLFRICVSSITPVVLVHFPLQCFLLLSGASCSLCVHDRKLHWICIFVKSLNPCTFWRTKQLEFYP